MPDPAVTPLKPCPGVLQLAPSERKFQDGLGLICDGTHLLQVLLGFRVRVRVGTHLLQVLMP